MDEYLLNFDKETINKFRWITKIDDVPFKLYIPQWRVPNPIPSTIKISLFTSPLPESKQAVTPALTASNPNLRMLPIVSHVNFCSEHSKTL